MEMKTEFNFRVNYPYTVSAKIIPDVASDMSLYSSFSHSLPLYLSQVTETRCKKVCTSKSDLRSNDFSIVGSLPRDFELSNFDCYGKPIEVSAALGKSQAKNNKKPPPPKPVIPSAAKRVDLYARAIFPFTFLFFNVIYWSVYL